MSIFGESGFYIENEPKRHPRKAGTHHTHFGKGSLFRIKPQYPTRGYAPHRFFQRFWRDRGALAFWGGKEGFKPTTSFEPLIR